jgi:hypothetical protein
MPWSDFLSSIVAGGAGGAAVGAVWHLVTNVFLEGRKTKLKKSEFLFQKQFEAVSQFMALRAAARSLLSEKSSSR